MFFTDPVSREMGILTSGSSTDSIGSLLLGGTLERHSKPGCQSVGPSDSLFETTCESSGCDEYSCYSLSCKWPAFPQRQWQKKKKVEEKKEFTKTKKKIEASYLTPRRRYRSHHDETPLIKSPVKVWPAHHHNCHFTVLEMPFIFFIFMGNSACFPRGKPAATELRHQTYRSTNHSGFSVVSLA